MLDRGKVPPWYKKRPMIVDWTLAQLVLRVFFDLTTTRTYGAMGGIFSIPWDKVMYYAEVHDLAPDAAQWLWEIVRDLDALYVHGYNDEAARKKPTRPDAEDPDSDRQNERPRIRRRR